MKKIIIGVLLLNVGLGLMAQKKVVINGTVTGDTKGANQIYVYGNGIETDTLYIKDGKFSGSVPFEKPFVFLMYTEFESKKGMYSPFPVLVDKPGTVTLSDFDIAKGFHSAKMTGVESAALYHKFNKQKGEEYKKVSEALKSKFGQPWMDEKDPKYAEFEKESDELQKKYIGTFLEKFVAEHPDSYATVVGLAGAGRSALTLEGQEKAYSKLSKRLQNTSEGKAIIDFVEGVRSSSIGSYVKDFTLNTPDEKPLNFKNDLKGKYVLIDFWASWCGPCKQSFPHMKEVYKKYKSDKFEIYSISIDADKAAWLKGVKEQDLPWVQTLDTKNISKKGFAVTGVPTTYLISPEGKILAKDVGFDPEGNGAIEKMLVEIFGDKGVSKSTTEPPRGVEAVKSVPSVLSTSSQAAEKPKAVKAVKMQ